ncbi:MAG TPA: penicillin-binding transpeptidase domain-containing protein [Anaerolineales bacterium]|nr:penicillin-binding transpeptidase domain-containing protein [Anaerolineales bacterium]
MKVFRWINSILILAFLSACGFGGAGGNPFNPFASPVPLPTPQVTIIPAPNAEAAVTAFFQALEKDDYETMYAMLAKSSREAITLEDFSKRWNDALNAMSAASFEYTINSSKISPFNAEVGYSITYKTALAGDIQRNIVMRLASEEGAWKVLWDDNLIMPELAGGNLLVMDYSVPARGDIYDRDGLPIVTQSDALAFGIQTEQIDPDLRGTLTAELGKLCGFDPLYIENLIDANGPGNYLAMCEGTRAEAQRLISINPGGLIIQEYNSRYYSGTGLAPQAVGYTQPITTEQLNSYRRLGYNGSERVGQTGIEKWAEDYLAGQHGGTLQVVGPGGQIISTLGQSSPQAADSVYLTIDSNMQAYAQKSIEFFRGAIVVMEVDTGRIIAMASAPDFDPNFFEPNNPNVGGGDLLTSTNEPLLNRAAQGQYPLGSVFKVITMSAALESGAWLKDTTYDCQYDFTKLPPPLVLHDWTWQHCQDAIAIGEFCDDSSTTPSGLLTLQQGLMRSCNPYFWEIGWDLYTNLNRGTDIANMARGFGLGSPTGIDEVEEESGQILDPTSDIDAVNQAIGQGDVQVTPLQVARFMAAIANGGTLYRPQIVERIQPIEGDPKLVFRPEANGTLPLRTENLDILREALLMVTQNSKGTARFNLRGLQFDVAGKTGTAESGNGLSHAWFAGYTLNQANTKLPDIAIAVIVENIGEGSEYAVPVFRAMVETYYYGGPQTTPWFGPVGQPPYTPTPFGQTSNEGE